MTRALPPSASIATPTDSAKLHAPSAERNAAHLTAFLTQHGPPQGDALEIASGTGQHVIAFAKALPNLTWQPTDVDATRLNSINHYVAGAALPNVAPAAHLDATTPGWATDHAAKSLIILINLLHLISDPEAQNIIAEAARALAPGGTFILYGPFKRGGQLTSEGDARFDAELRGADPAIGYKDTAQITAWLAAAGLSAASHDMPANNLAFVCRKPSP